MPEYSTSFSKYRAYVVGKQTLEAICNVAQRFIDAAPTVTVYLDDDHEVQDTNLSVLVSDTFVLGKNIKRITIEGRKTLSNPVITRSLSVNFEVDLLHIVTVRIAGERDRSLAARREIEVALEGAEA